MKLLMHPHMAMRQKQNRDKGMTKAEEWFFKNYLSEMTDRKWTFQTQWQWRLFDFWNAELGVAFEIDGPEHDFIYDYGRDCLEWARSRIIVLRVPNFDDKTAARQMLLLHSIGSWKERRKSIPSTGEGKKEHKQKVNDLKQQLKEIYLMKNKQAVSDPLYDKGETIIL